MGFAIGLPVANVANASLAVVDQSCGTLTVTSVCGAMMTTCPATTHCTVPELYSVGVEMPLKYVEPFRAAFAAALAMILT